MMKKLKETKGGISIFTIMILAFLLPFAFWVGIELPKIHEANQRVKDAVDSSASSAVTLIMGNVDKSENYLAKGQFRIGDEGRYEIEQTAKEILGLKMGLSYDRNTKKFEIPPGSSISQDIEVEVQTIGDEKISINGVAIVDSKLETGRWTKKIDSPTVIVEAKITFKKIGSFGKDITVKQVGMSQIKLAEPVEQD